MFEIPDEFLEMQQMAEKAAKLDEILGKVPEGISPAEYVQLVGTQLGITLLPSESPMYDTPEEAKEASEKPDLQLLKPFEEAVVKNYLKLDD